MKFISPYETDWGDSKELFAFNIKEWKYQRPVTNVSKCCQCGICYLFCPTGCVRDMGGYYAADLEYCKGCSICAKMCPIDAIEMVREE